LDRRPDRRRGRELLPDARARSVRLKPPRYQPSEGAVAAKKPSMTDSAMPLRRLCAIRSPQCSATALSIGRIRSAKRSGRSLVSQATIEAREARAHRGILDEPDGALGLQSRQELFDSPFCAFRWGGVAATVMLQHPDAKVEAGAVNGGQLTRPVVEPTFR
jgi:hypothetical protein